MGDPAGVGPEILLKAIHAGALNKPFVVIGDKQALVLAQNCLHLENIPPFECIDLHCFNSPTEITPGKMDAAYGRAAYLAIEQAARLVLDGEASAMVTLPVNKEAIQLTVQGFSGHTEMIAEMCGQQSCTMMLCSDQLTVTHVSTHVSMLEAVKAVTQARVLETIILTHDALCSRLASPRIAVAGLNAHAGENGLFGREELDEIRPAVEKARSSGVNASGPYPPDTVFLRASRGEFDAVVCMYHDQGHIPLKLMDFHGGVNVTLGLNNIIRTSVDHGTAFDIAYQGKAEPESFIRAFRMAVAMVRKTADF